MRIVLITVIDFLKDDNIFYGEMYFNMEQKNKNVENTTIYLLKVIMNGRMRKSSQKIKPQVCERKAPIDMNNKQTQ